MRNVLEKGEKTGDGWFLRLFRGVRILLHLVTGKKPDISECFETLYALRRDPWRYESSAYEREKYATTMELLKGKRFRRVLEAGCSEGVFTSLLAPLGDEILGVDISPTAVRRAMKRNGNRQHLSFSVMDIENEEPAGTFDLILCSEMLYYLDDVNRIAKIRDRFIRWLEPGGNLLLVHMRRKTDDTDGFDSPPLGFPSMGAATVHGVFRNQPALIEVHEVQQPKYTATLFEKIRKP